jgi:hypothetical protein
MQSAQVAGILKYGQILAVDFIDVIQPHHQILIRLCIRFNKPYDPLFIYSQVKAQLPKGPQFADSDLVLLNHSCNPNLIVNTEKGLVYSSKDIYPGEELNYFYPSTEWDMCRPFACKCGSPQCLKYIRGALWTPLNYLLSTFLNKHIVELIQKSIAEACIFENYI